MPGGRRNPLSMSNMLEQIGDVVNSAKADAKEREKHMHDVAKSMVGDKLLNVPYVDLQIQFIGASGLPKMDVVGSADPYFVAKIDDRISFVSKVIANDLKPVWNEVWRVKNVPSNADLKVEVLDKDEGAPHDDFVGKFKTSVSAGTKEAEIEGPVLRRARGTFWLKIESTRAADSDPHKHAYLFDGPIRYSRHFSPTVGRLTNLDDARLYSTWKMYLKATPLFFGDTYQHWNENYKAAQSIFQGPTSIAVRSGIQAGHRMLYARTATNGFGVIEDPSGILAVLHGGKSRPHCSASSTASQFSHRVKPAVYTYILSADDDSFRFSETGAAFFVDFASKHALHSNCSETVRYSGEFHPRPEGGWDKFSDDISDDQVRWEFVIDNNSGTYAPDPTMLPKLKELLEYNFPSFKIFALDHEDSKLVESREACRAYAVKFRGIGQDELQPHAEEGEETLSHQASMLRPQSPAKIHEKVMKHMRSSSSKSGSSRSSSPAAGGSKTP